ncbi:MAG: hypothetical protein PHG75_08455 [Syntrophomonas sp.]|nr:hypothetical protein [Syntrophomonas sp.]
MKVICLFMAIMLAMLLQAAGEDGQNATMSPNANLTADKNISINESRDGMSVIALGSGNRNAGKVLRAGFQEKKAVNDLDVYGNRSVHVIPPQVPAQWSFDISQRVGNVSKFDYSNSFKPLFSMSPYSRTKAVYQAPSNLSSRPVYSISGYPRIKIASGIP